MEQTPIEKAIAELERMQTLQSIEMTSYGLQTAINHLTSLLPFEKTYHRNIAEKAIDWTLQNIETDLDPTPLFDTDVYVSIDKQTYLNQNYPL